MGRHANKPWQTGGRGFTLIEAILALLVFAILAGIAYPSYTESVRAGRRAEGRAALFMLMQQQERYYSRHNSYIAFSFSSTDEDEKRFKWFSGPSAKSSAYEIQAEACENDTIRDCVQLTAIPGTGNVDSRYEDPICGRLGLTSTGFKHAKRSDCWK